MHLCTYVIEEGGDGEAVFSETPSLMSYILRCVSFVEVDSVCRTALRKPMYQCTCVSEEVGDREGEGEGGDASIVLNKVKRSCRICRVCNFCCLLLIDKARAKDKTYI
jgi:hypothetical protein